MDDSLKKAQKKYEATDKGKGRKKRYRKKPDVQQSEYERNKKRSRAEYMRERRRKIKEQSNTI
jgi:hypothetical protein